LEIAFLPWIVKRKRGSGHKNRASLLPRVFTEPSAWQNRVAAGGVLHENNSTESVFADMNHSEIDQVSLEMARRVADRMRHNPELLEIGRG
jgi:hypothetical protein